MKIKAYTLFTPSHEKFLKEYLLDSFKYNPNIDLTIINKPQLCETAEFGTDGWNATMEYKASCFYENLKRCDEEKEYFMFIDPDIVIYRDFYDDIIKRMEGKDVVWQNDGPGGVNTGFFCVRNNKTTRSFFKTVLGNLTKFEEEQRTANYLLRNLHNFPSIQIKWAVLPNEYWTYGHIAGQPDGKGGLKGHWFNTDETFPIPDNIFIHHGNWTRTKDDKYKILDIVRKRINGS
jgi:hypothetical protein